MARHLKIDWKIILVNAISLKKCEVKMSDKKKNSNAGFSLVELIIVIAIMAVLGSLLSVVYLHFIEEARKTRALACARALYKASQLAIIDASIYEEDAFRYALKFEETIDGEQVRMGRFSNQSLYKFLQESNGAPSQSGALSKAADYHIAQQIAGSIPGADSEITSDLLKDKSPIGDSHSTQYIAAHPNEYGEVVFAMAYNEYGEIIYFQCVYDNYFMTWSSSTDYTAERVSESTKFNNWPRTRAAGAEKW